MGTSLTLLSPPVPHMPTPAHLARDRGRVGRLVIFRKCLRRLREQAICFRFGWIALMAELPMSFLCHGMETLSLIKQIFLSSGGRTFNSWSRLREPARFFNSDSGMIRAISVLMTSAWLI